MKILIGTLATLCWLGFCSFCCVMALRTSHYGAPTEEVWNTAPENTNAFFETTNFGAGPIRIIDVPGITTMRASDLQAMERRTDLQTSEDVVFLGGPAGSGVGATTLEQARAPLPVGRTWLHATGDPDEAFLAVVTGQMEGAGTNRGAAELKALLDVHSELVFKVAVRYAVEFLPAHPELVTNGEHWSAYADLCWSARTNRGK